MTIDEIRKVEGLEVVDGERFTTVRAKSGYRLLVGEEHEEERMTDDGVLVKETVGPTETDCVYLPKGCLDAPVLSAEESGVMTTDETEDGGAVLTVEQRLASLEGRVSALEADLAQMQTGDGGGAAMMTDDDL